VHPLPAPYRNRDQKTVARILGEKGLRLGSSGDPVIDRYDREWFLSFYKEGLDDLLSFARIISH
jgi:hypothetical protein